MRGKKAKRIRKMMRHFGTGEAGPKLGDNRTVRYFYRSADGLVVKSASDMGPPGSAALVATYTLTRQPNDPRRMYRRVKSMRADQPVPRKRYVPGFMSRQIRKASHG